MNFVIMGVGAMGCLFGARLAPFTAVTLLGSWPQQVQAIRQNGLTLIEPDGRSRHQSIHATHQLQEIPPADVVLIAVKSHQTERVARQAQQILAPHGLVLTLQNGIGNLETITAVISENPVTLGTTSEGATIVEPGIVRHAGWGHTYLSQTEETAVRIQQIAALLRQAGFQTDITNNVDGLIWGKLAVNAGINPLTALLRVPNGFLAENAAARALMQAAANEVAQVAAAQDIQLPFADAGQQALEVAQATAANHSSMLQDVLRGAPTEIDVICGAVVKYGRLYNIPTPINEQLWTAVKTNSPFTIHNSQFTIHNSKGIPMLVTDSITTVRATRWADPAASWGLVPTMGFLHEGHLSLVRQAKAENEFTAVTIFVNPAQFAPSEDLSSYPRDLQRDLSMLKAAGVDLVFTPSDVVVYPPDFQTAVIVKEVSQPLEGKSRPTHFDGVATVVAKLFNIIQPSRAYFGQKDAQQTVVLRQMVRDLNFNLEMIVCPTVREADGLAMSSRNAYLNPAERAVAAVLYRGLTAVQTSYQQGERDAQKLRQMLTKTIISEPLAHLDYVSIADRHTLQELDTIQDGALVSLAVFFGKTRLIDNLILPP